MRGLMQDTPLTIELVLSRDRVAKWWVPERIELLDAIPRTAVGKDDKRALRARHRARA